MLPPVVATLLLHLALCAVALACFAVAAERVAGRGAALAATALLGLNPQFLRAVGWDYVDGFGIAYLLVALALLARADGSSRRSWLLFGAGAALAGVLSCSLFYGVLGLPFAWELLAAWRERHGSARELLSEIGRIAAGGALTLAALAVASALAGGRLFFLVGSFRFVGHSVETADPFRHPLAEWLPTAYWLATPALAAAGAVVVLLRRGQPPAVRRAQGQHLALCAFFVALQLRGNFHSLEYFYYASLLLPTSFLAFAGQIQALWGVDRKWVLPFAALALAGLVITLLAPFPASTLVWARRLLLASLIVGPLWPLALLSRRAVAALLLPLLVAITFSMWRPYLGPPGTAMHRLEQMEGVIAALKSNPGGEWPRLWYDQHEPQSGVVADAIASAFLLCPSMISGNFPQLPASGTCNGQPLERNQRIAVLTSRADWWPTASAALARFGRPMERLGETRFAGDPPLRVGWLIVR